VQRRKNGQLAKAALDHWKKKMIPLKEEMKNILSQLFVGQAK